MLKLIFSFLLLLSFSCVAQNIEKIINQERQQIDRVDIRLSDRITYISSNFAKPQITTTNLRDKVRVLAITKVYYVYTAYRRSSDFDQKALDRKRFEQLKELYPILFESPLIEWEILEQTGLEVYTEGEGYFHGFILVHRPLPTDAGREKEFDLVSQFLNNPTEGLPLIEEDPIANLFTPTAIIDKKESIDVMDAEFDGGDQALLEHIQNNLDMPNEVWKDRKDFWASFSVVVNQSGKAEIIDFAAEYGKPVEKAIRDAINAMPLWTPKSINGQPVIDTVNFEWRISYSPQLKGMYLKNGKPPILGHTIEEIANDPIHSSLVKTEDILMNPVYVAFSKVPTSQQLAIVMDVTGSMANHIISASFWLTEHMDSLPFTSFAAFNDGDDTKDDEKIIGSTGGIYYTAFMSEFSNSIRTAMQKGNGGDYPENDIEAILYASRNDKQATGVLLVADNMSAVKDFDLLYKVELPVSVLPCGLTGSINQNYLDIVFKTGGSIYYNDQVINLQKLSKGETFKIRRTTYVHSGRRIEVAN
ncbi:MAG: hypothetical protein R3279_02330 [Putridiphycobacter sp.]|nr:hypothetical protein [Putridiphycobacter sp.]